MTSLLSPEQRFEKFGRTFLAANAIGTSCQIRIPGARLAARKLLREKCPSTPGVYGWLDGNGQLGYVGKSKALKKRLLSYFSKTVPDEKMNRIRQQSRTIIWEPISHELLALLREQELINRWRPSFNSQGQPTRRKPAFICISNTAAPNAIMQRQLTQRSLHRFGPIAGTGELRDAIDNLNNLFGLRDCPDKTTIQFNNQLSLFDAERNAKCIRHELSTCPGPCAGACSKTNYMEGVERALKFLQGVDQSVLKQLTARMNNAAAKQQFETAAIYRDRLASLSWLNRRLESLRRARMDLNCVYEIEGLRKTKVWLILDGGLPIACVPAARNKTTAQQAISPLKAIAASNEKYPAGPLETNFLMIAISWFRQRKHEQQSLQPVHQALDQCQQMLSRQPIRNSA